MFRVSGSEWRSVGGVPCIVFRAADDAGAQTEVALPVAALPTLAAQARRVMAASQAAQDRSLAKGPWRPTHPLDAEKFHVETMPTDTGDRIVLTIDPETDVETPYSIEPGVARELGQALVEEADRASRTAPAKN